MSTHLLQFPFAVSKQFCLLTLTCFKSWDQKLSSGLLLNFMPTHFFQFRFAVTEQFWLDVPQGLGSGVVSCFDAHVYGRTPLPVPLCSC